MRERREGRKGKARGEGRGRKGGKGKGGEGINLPHGRLKTLAALSSICFYMQWLAYRQSSSCYSSQPTDNPSIMHCLASLQLA